MIIGSDKNIITIKVVQLHNNIPKILSKINIILIIKSITTKINSSLILNKYLDNLAIYQNLFPKAAQLI